jgi:hypothetical protein
MADIRPLKRTSTEKSAAYSSSVIHNLEEIEIRSSARRSKPYSAFAFECGATRIAELADHVIWVSNVESLP